MEKRCLKYFWYSVAMLAFVVSIILAFAIFFQWTPISLALLGIPAGLFVCLLLSKIDILED